MTVNRTNKTISATVTLTADVVTALNGAFGLTLTGTPVLGTIVSTPTS
ncbi:MAG: hypothetical protein F2832_03495 [Actinobacteria bacterium]|nr:hypothetical protein [Actinomycetota bacterium]